MWIDERVARIGEARVAWRWVLVVCLLYAASFAAFYPRAVTNHDEAQYCRQAALIVQGKATVTQIDPLTGEEKVLYPSTRPPGTAMVMAPFVAVGGWRAGYLVPFLSLMASVLLLARWLGDEGRSPLFALLLFGYPSALVMGRVAMSDVPSMAVVVLGLWLFWRGIEGGARWWLASGLVAGASMAFRDSNPICFAPFFAGAVLRRDRGWWALLAGGLVGLGIRLVSYGLFLGDPLYQRSPYQLALGTVHQRLPLYLLATMVFVPGGLLLALLYRGRRRPELLVVVVGFFTAYLIQRYYTFATSMVKNLVNTPRYLLPLVPVMSFAMGESVPRLWRRLLEGAGEERRRTLERWGPRAVGAWVAGVAVLAVCVHPAFYLWSGTQARIRNAIVENTDNQAVLVTNLHATRKFIDELDQKYRPVDSRDISVQDANALVQRYGEVYVALLDRSDSAFWRKDMALNAEFAAGLAPELVLLVDREMSPTDHLRIWRVTRD
jgi:hypothetical protein